MSRGAVTTRVESGADDQVLAVDDATGGLGGDPGRRRSLVSAASLRTNLGNVGYASVSLIALLLGWDLLVRFFDVPSYLLPAPAAVLTTTWAERARLIDHSIVTATASVLAFLLAVGVGTALGMVIAFSRPLARLIYPVLVGSNAVPKIALAPLFIVWVGFGMTSKVLIGFTIAFFPIVINTIAGLRAVPQDMIELARSMGGGPWKTFWKIRVPYALPSFFAGLKVGIAFAVIGAIVGEFVAADRGLGYLLILTGGSLHTTLMYAALIVLTAVALILYAVVELLDYALTPGPKRTESGVA